MVRIPMLAQLGPHRSATAPRAPNGKPDLSGVWVGNAPDVDAPVMLPWAEAVTKERRAKGAGNPGESCLPGDVFLVSPFLYKIIQTPSVIAILWEGNVPAVVQIFLDGRPHAKDAFPSWMGDSIGRWERDTLVVDTVGFALSLGITDIAVGIEDASRGEDDLLRALTEAAVDAGSTCIILADTTGCHTPEEFGALIGKIRRWAPPPIKVSTHCHNDFGLATANTLAGLAAGADEIQVALGGIGERAGNTSLEEVAAVLAYKTESLGMTTGIRLEAMYAAYNRLREIIRLEEPRNKAIFGTYAFGTAAGIHQQGMLSDPSTYEYVEPARFGRERSLLIGRHSGRTVLRHLIEQLDVRVDEAELDELYRVHIAEREQGDCEDLAVVRERLARELRTRLSVAAAP